MLARNLSSAFESWCSYLLHIYAFQLFQPQDYLVPGHSATQAFSCATSASITALQPALTSPFFVTRSEVWKPPGTMLTGACGVDCNIPPGRKSEDTPDSLHGSKPPFAQIRRVEGVRFQPLVYALTSASVLPVALANVKPSGAVGKYRGHCRCQYSAVTVRETIEDLLVGAPSCQYL